MVVLVAMNTTLTRTLIMIMTMTLKVTMKMTTRAMTVAAVAQHWSTIALPQNTDPYGRVI